MIVSPMSTMMMIVHLFLVGFFGLFAALLDDLDVVVKNCGNDRHHIGLDNSCSYALCSPHTDVDDALES